jgi:hypothetical protein
MFGGWDGNKQMAFGLEDEMAAVKESPWIAGMFKDVRCPNDIEPRMPYRPEVLKEPTLKGTQVALPLIRVNGCAFPLAGPILDVIVVVSRPDHQRPARAGKIK